MLRSEPVDVPGGMSNVASNSDTQISCGHPWSALPRELLVDVLSVLPLDSLPAVALTCSSWCMCTPDAFAYWLRWRRAPAAPCEPPVTRCPLPIDDPDHVWHAAAGAARVVRGYGCMDWADDSGSALVICRADAPGRSVLTARIPLAMLVGAGCRRRHAAGDVPSASKPDAGPTESTPRWLRRRWPFHTLVGGLSGGMVGHANRSDVGFTDRTAFFPPRTDEVVALDAEYQNILSAGVQTFLLRRRRDSWCPETGAFSGVIHADVLDLATRRVRAVDVTRLFEAFEQLAHDSHSDSDSDSDSDGDGGGGGDSEQRRISMQAVSATCSHFVLHGACSDGSKIAAAVQLPDASVLATDTRVVPRLVEGTDQPLPPPPASQPTHTAQAGSTRGDKHDPPPMLEPTFAKRWGRRRPIASIGKQNLAQQHSYPGEKSCGRCLLLHPMKVSRPAEGDRARCCFALSVLHADSGRVDDLRFRAPWGHNLQSDSFWNYNSILDVTMDRSRSVLAACIALPCLEDERASTLAQVSNRRCLYAAVVWAVPSGIPLAVVDLRSVSEAGTCVSSVQALLHPTEPSLVLGLSGHSGRSRQATYYRTLIVHWMTSA